MSSFLHESTTPTPSNQVLGTFSNLPPCRRAVLLLWRRSNYSTLALHQNNPFLRPRLRVAINNTLPAHLAEGRCITSLLTTAVGAICLVNSEASRRFDLGILSGSSLSPLSTSSILDSHGELKMEQILRLRARLIGAGRSLVSWGPWVRFEGDRI
jgi:hypothetical protein